MDYQIDRDRLLSVDTIDNFDVRRVRKLHQRYFCSKNIFDLNFETVAEIRFRNHFDTAYGILAPARIHRNRNYGYIELSDLV